MRAVTVAVWLAAYVSFTWGVLCFFLRPDGLTGRARLVAVLGAAFGVWHAVALATARTGAMFHLLGCALLVAAIVLFWSAVRACGSRPLTTIFSCDAPLRLVSVGPYRCMRHPFYTAYTMFWFAGGLAAGSVVSLLSACVMLALYLDAARHEERKFETSALADVYAVYRRSSASFRWRRNAAASAGATRDETR